MKKFSLKTKLTVVYTFFMILLVSVFLWILLSLSNREVLSFTQRDLKERVEESLEDVQIDNKKIQLDSEFYSIENGVYLSLYDENGYFLYGKIPPGFDEQPQLKEDELQQFQSKKKNEKWYVYDLSYRLDSNWKLYVRGVTSVTKAEQSYRTTVKMAVIFLPAMVLIMALTGYFFVCRTLRPVKNLTNVVKKIRSDADLSRRVQLPEHSGVTKTKKEKMHDEISILSETFNEMLDELERVFIREQQFTSDVSHELRTLISVILAQCDHVLSDQTLTDDQRTQIELIRRKSQNMANLISQLLFLSRADQGRQALNKEFLNISELTEMIVQEQQFLAESKEMDVEIRASIEPQLFGKVDETLYIRLVSNLISNAVKYGGTQIEVELYREDFAECDGQKNDEGVRQVCITGKIKDNGDGISVNHLPYIWNRFYTVDSSKNKENSYGLGLPMVKWIAQAHGGNVDVESEEGRGSVFRFHLPLK